MIRSGSPSIYVGGLMRLAAIPRRADTPETFRLYRVRLRGSISPGAANALAQAIQTQEGYYPGSLAYQNNNPGNLVYAGQTGATQGAGGFAAFDSYSDGYNALVAQITLDATRGTDVAGNPTQTVSQLIASWAPPSENDTASYIANVAAATGFDPNASLSSLVSGSAPDFSSVFAAGSDLGDDLASPVDLSSVGIPDTVPVWALLAAGAAAVFLISTR